MAEENGEQTEITRRRRRLSRRSKGGHRRGARDELYGEIDLDMQKEKADRVADITAGLPSAPR